MQESAETHLENNHISILLEDGIIHFTYKPELIITLDVAKQTVANRLRISNGISRPVLADIRVMSSVDDNAREYLASKEAGQFISALGILTNNPIQNLFANFYLRINKPPMPTQLFTNKEKAIRWLTLYKQLN